MSTPDPGEGGVIIIKGGSCELHFDEGVFSYDTTEANRRKHKCDERMKIKQIVITGNGQTYSHDIPEGFKGEIRIVCR
jgi:hypothetical protein